MDRLEGEDALRALLAALAQQSENAEAHLAIGQILLARGEMKAGWIEYKWRKKLEMAKGMVPELADDFRDGSRHDSGCDTLA
jgi:hypothetical protein